MNRPRPTDAAGRILEITRVFDAPRDELFRFFVDPAAIAMWWGPDGFATPADRIDVEVRPGGRHHKTMLLESPEIAAAMDVPVGTPFPDAATVMEVAAPELLVLTSEPQPEMGLIERTVSRIEFQADGPRRTRVSLVDGPYSEMMAPNAEMGWAQSFGKLERHLAGGTP
jgi:uncharacterized protein YndB with AHSA1/START domain